VTSLQEKAQTGRFKIPLFVATDQEGGIVRHVKGNTSDTPGNLAIGASGYPIDAWYSGYYIARELRALGINMNFAPTIDVYSDLESSVIGPRSFGDDPVQAGILGVLFAEGTQAAGVIPTAKHFPGHGDTGDDSHGRLPVIDIDKDTFFARELVPFEYAVNSKIPAIMSGHLSFPQIVGSGTPASLSRELLTGLLREELGYVGLIITDDMRMNGALLFAGSLPDAYRMAIDAGNDIIISSATAQLGEALWQQNLDLIRSSPEFRSRVTAAARRILYAKLVYFKGDGTSAGANPVPLYTDIEMLPSLVPDREGEAFFFNLACRSITLQKQGAIPYTGGAGERVLLAGYAPAFFLEGRKRYPGAGVFRFMTSNNEAENAAIANRLAASASGYDTVFLCVGDDADARIARSLRSAGKRVIIVSVTSPVPSFNLEWADTILYTYSTSPASFDAAFGALAGEFTPRGTLPIRKGTK
jgi:beta-N-acetylhexosaminidase